MIKVPLPPTRYRSSRHWQRVHERCVHQKRRVQWERALFSSMNDNPEVWQVIRTIRYYPCASSNLGRICIDSSVCSPSKGLLTVQRRCCKIHENLLASGPIDQSWCLQGYQMCESESESLEILCLSLNKVRFFSCHFSLVTWSQVRVPHNFNFTNFFCNFQSINSIIHSTSLKIAPAIDSLSSYHLCETQAINNPQVLHFAPCSWIWKWHLQESQKLQ